MLNVLLLFNKTHFLLKNASQNFRKHFLLFAVYCYFTLCFFCRHTTVSVAECSQSHFSLLVFLNIPDMSRTSAFFANSVTASTCIALAICLNRKHFSATPI